MSYPGEEVAQAIETGWLFQQFRNIFRDSGEALSLIESSVDDFKDIEELQVAYTTQFDLKIPLYESYYVIKDGKPEARGRYLYELEKFYLDAGVGLTDRDMPDYLPTELEFMHYLYAENKIDKQGFFLENHLKNWIGDLMEKVNQENVIFYRYVLESLRKFLYLVGD